MMFWRRHDTTLLAVRLDDMVVVPLRTDRSQLCAECGQAVGITRSGQDVIRRYGRRHVRIVCSRCLSPDAPGAVKVASRS